MPFELRYPDETSPTASWLPSTCPSVQGSSQEQFGGIVTQRTGDPLKVYRYQMGRSGRLWVMNFELLSAAEKESFDTFRSAVMGDTFKMRDPADGLLYNEGGYGEGPYPLTGPYYLVIFDEYDWKWRVMASKPVRWGVGLSFRQVAS